MKNVESAVTVAPRPSSLRPPRDWLDRQVTAAQAPQLSEKTIQAPSETESNPDPVALEVSALQDDPVKILSDQPLSDWRGSVTIFEGFYRTTPKQELEHANWDEVCNLICPPKPDFLSDKRDGKYFVPCLLQEAPLTGNTLEVAKMKLLPTIGKMRSANHVTEALFLLIDLDGISEAEFVDLLGQLKIEGITFVAFTTHSHGDPAKPGMRVRLVIPLDRPVSPEDYKAVWHGFNQQYFSGQTGKADPSGAKLYQQQGTFCCHPSRILQAKFWHHDAGVASANALIQIGQTVQPPIIPDILETVDGDAPVSTVPIGKIIELLQCIDPDLAYPDWFRVLMSVAHTTSGSQEGLDVVDGWCSHGKKYKGFRDVQKTYKNYRPEHPRPIKIGTLIRLAREAGADTDAILHGETFEVCESEDPGSDEIDLAAPSENIPDLGVCRS